MVECWLTFAEVLYYLSAFMAECCLMSYAGVLYDLHDFQGGILIDSRKGAVLSICFHGGVLINIRRYALRSI